MKEQFDSFKNRFFFKYLIVFLSILLTGFLFLLHFCINQTSEKPKQKIIQLKLKTL